MTSNNLTTREKDERIIKLTRAVELLQYEKSKSEFMRNFLVFIAKERPYEDFFADSVLFFRHEFKSAYAAFFLYNKENYNFTYLVGTGYKEETMPVIDESGSIIGETIHTQDTVIVNDIKERYFHFPLNQSPPETNVVCVPIYTKKKTLVLRIANVQDGNLFVALSTVLKSMANIFAQTIDHIYENSINQQTIRGVQFTLSISRLLEKTLERREIIHRAFLKIAALSESTVQMIAVREGHSIVLIEKSLPDFYLGGSPAAHSVYLKNLMETFPDGVGFIENLHKMPRWSWSNIHYISINLVPLIIEQRVIGTLISISRDEPFGDSLRALFGLAAAQTSITLERAFYIHQQEEFATKDGLTGLFNRRMFDTLLASETAVSGRYHRPLSMIIMDIDHFKSFNDTYGHKTGDEVIQLVSNTIASTIRTSDRAFRYGGEEFVIMCPETNAENSALVAERLRQRIEQAHTKDKLRVTISLGVSEYIAGESTEAFTRRADALLYKSKESGRNQVSVG